MSIGTVEEKNLNYHEELAPGLGSPGTARVEVPYAVQLEFFSGPMDLLLHLVHSQEINIETVDMSLIAEQYLRIVSSARYLDLEKASEYLVIAATLMAIKSESLLPQDQGKGTEETLAAEMHDLGFYEQLRERLKQYELTKLRAASLVDMSQLEVDVFARVDRKALQSEVEFLINPEEDQVSLTQAFAGLLKRIGAGIASFKVKFESVSIVSYMMKIVDLLQGGIDSEGVVKADTSFSGIILGFYRSRFNPSKTDSPKRVNETAVRGIVVGSFVAILELVKRHVIVADQVSDSADIVVKQKLLVNHNPMIENLDSEFDHEDESKVIELKHYRKGQKDNTGKGEWIDAKQRKEVNRG